MNPFHTLLERFLESVCFGLGFVCFCQYIKSEVFICVYTYACIVSLMHRPEYITLRCVLRNEEFG